MTKGTRGAITVDNNSADSLKEATVTLLNEMIKQNSLDISKISHVIFTTTDDINCAFPAKYARVDMGWSDVAMMCYHEMDVENALKMCLRVLIVYNCEESFIPKFVYLRGAENLR